MIEAYDYFGLNSLTDTRKYFNTEAHRKVAKTIQFSIQQGGIFALIGMVGSGKTTLLNRLQNDIDKEGKVIVSRSLSTDKKRVNVNTLFTALFYDLNKKEKQVKFPAAGEKRERELISLFKKYKKPVVLFIDEAHDLHGQTLIALKRIIEVVAQDGFILSIILAGHPKLLNSLATASMEEIGARIETMSLDGSIGDNDKFIKWWFKESSNKTVSIENQISSDAIKFLAKELLTPLQIIYYIRKAIQLAYETDEKPISIDIAKQVIYPDLKSVKSVLARNGYQEQAVCELLNASKKEVNDFFAGKGNKDRNLEFTQKIQKMNIGV